ncbi:MAG: hypothetical protein NC541_10800 [bacterium]|nr:hypothetical protein [bacterium]
MKGLKYLACALSAVAVCFAVYAAYAYVSFSRGGLDTGLAGQTDGAHYPDWGENLETLKADCDILDRDGLYLSKVYLIRRSDSVQLRFRMAYCIPFCHGDLLGDTEWVKLTDSSGNDYFGNLAVSASEIAGLNCIEASLIMDEETFSGLSGGKLTVSAVCTEGSGNGDGAYAGCEMEISVPEL